MKRRKDPWFCERTPYMKLSMTKRGDIYTNIKNHITRERVTRGRNFYTHDLLEDETGYKATSAEFYFLSSTRKKVFYYTFLSTAQVVLYEKARDKVFEDAHWAFEKFGIGEFKTEVVQRDAWGRPFIYKMDTSKWDAKHEELGGRTYYEYTQFKTDEYLKTNKPPIYESFTLDETCDYGIMLHMTIDRDIVTVDTINEYIDRFIKNGEKDWVASQPIDPNRLIYAYDPK